MSAIRTTSSTAIITTALSRKRKPNEFPTHIESALKKMAEREQSAQTSTSNLFNPIHSSQRIVDESFKELYFPTRDSL